MHLTAGSSHPVVALGFELSLDLSLLAAADFEGPCHHSQDEAGAVAQPLQLQFRSLDVGWATQ